MAVTDARLAEISAATIPDQFNAAT